MKRLFAGVALAGVLAVGCSQGPAQSPVVVQSPASPVAPITPELPTGNTAEDCKVDVATEFDRIVALSVVGDRVEGSRVDVALQTSVLDEPELTILAATFLYYFEYPADHEASVQAAYLDVVVPECDYAYGASSTTSVA